MKHTTPITTPLVSVVIPVFNGSSYIKRAVDSALKSSYKNIEIILVDDGSTDQSQFVCQTLAKKYKKVTYCGFTKNKGQGIALNYALKKAKGKYICRLNQDDTMFKSRIATQVKYLTKHPSVVALGSSIILVDEKNQSQIVHYLEGDAEIRKVWLVLSPFSDPSVMFDRLVALKVGGHDQSFWPANDTQLWIKMAQYGQLANIKKPLVKVLYHTKCASVQHFKKLTQITHKMHQWMHNNIQPAPWYIHLFWFGEHACGMLFSPNFNWAVYRIIKKLVHLLAIFFDFVKKTKVKLADKLTIQPIMASVSGQ